MSSRARAAGDPPSAKVLRLPDVIDATFGFLSSKGDIDTRPEQVEVARKIYTSLCGGDPLVVEAPPGTGKTIAYLAGAIEAGKARGLPVVVATATVALQEQALVWDIPRFIASGLIAASQVEVAKGRGRYFCPLRADGATQRESAGVEQMGLDFGATVAVQTSMRPQDAAELLSTWESGAWDGDIDHWAQHADKLSGWHDVNASADSCITRQCPNFDRCPYFMARKRLPTARLILTNQDIVLSDLFMRGECVDGAEPERTLLPFKSYLLVVDEAHHLPEKAAENARSGFELSMGLSLAREVLMLSRHLKPFAAAYRAYVGADGIASKLGSMLLLLNAALGKKTMDTPPGSWFRLQGGSRVLAGDIKALMLSASGVAGDLYDCLSKTQSTLKSKSTGEGGDKIRLSHLLSTLARLVSSVSDLHRTLLTVRAGTEQVVWVEKREGAEGLALMTGPMDGSGTLDKFLWKRKDIPVVLVSATLRALGKFDRFRTRAALPGNTLYHVVEGRFPYHKSTLRVPLNALNPKDPRYLVDLAKDLVHEINVNEGTLVLFNSRALMVAVGKQLPPEIKKLWLQQGTLKSAELLIEHKRRINAGQGSVLAGMRTFSEGLDLPGAYCTHVILTRLPFNCPDNPVEEAREENNHRDGINHFGACALPDASLWLTQITGRLIRRDDDTGRITCMDSRLRDTQWGQSLVRGLPNYNLEM